MQSFVRYLLLLFFLVLTANSYCVSTELKANNEIKKVVENFCLIEFQGKLMDEERGTLVTYSPTSEDSKKFEILSKDASDGEHLYPYEWNMSKDSFFIVDSYNVVSVKQIDETHAYAAINYHQLAKVVKNSSNEENSLKNFSKDEKNMVVNLEVALITKGLTRNNEHEYQWLIVNPPYPKVSFDAVLKYYVDKATYAQKRTIDKSNPQNINKYTEKYQNYKTIIDFLVKLKNRDNEKK